MLKINNLEELESLKESYDIECKLALGKDGKGSLPKDIWETYSAFANTDGGYIILGVREKKDSFKLEGIENIEKVKKDLFNTVNSSKVSANVITNKSVEVLEFDNKKALVIYVPRAKRIEQPIFLNSNPFGNSYRRIHEADQKLSDEQIKRMLAEQVNDSRDSIVLPHYGIDDIHHESLRAYRQLYTNLNPTAPWNELEDLEFLRSIGAWKVNRETNERGLTIAGLLMFSTHPVIQEIFPNYMLDYQERPEAKTELRWVDRVT